MSCFYQVHPERYQIPATLVQPLWFRRCESLSDDGLVYDPIATQACRSCELTPDCLTGNIAQKQLLYATLTHIFDQQVRQYLSYYPDAWILNVGARLDTRFYRVDNGRCHWLEVDVSENLQWRQKLFHPSERYQHLNGRVDSLAWLNDLDISESVPLLILCEYALLDSSATVITQFLRGLGLRFSHAHACFNLAGDRTHTALGQQMGSGHYPHGFASSRDAVLNCLPWTQEVNAFSPLDHPCRRWLFWQRWFRLFSSLKYRYTPVVIKMCW